MKSWKILKTELSYGKCCTTQTTNYCGACQSGSRDVEVNVDEVIEKPELVSIIRMVPILEVNSAHENQANTKSHKRSRHHGCPV